jgi:hypothetical protein
MFRKTKDSQLNIFSSPSSLLSGKSQKMYENNNSWHNKFREQVTSRIDESLFKPLFSSTNGTPNSSIKVMISMMILKEAEGLSDQKLFENCRFNMLTRSAIGLFNADDAVPADSTYYLFRKKIVDYANKGNANLLETVFAQITKDQATEFEVSGKSVRMDSKLLGSNIAYLTRYELVHETLRLFFKDVKKIGKIDAATTLILEELLRFEGNKIVYMYSGDEVKTRLNQLGLLINKILPLFSAASSTHYNTLKRVFDEQFKLTQDKVVVARNNDEISSKSVQSPHDTDCTYRNKDGNKVKGYSVNVTESCDEQGKLNLIGNVDVRTSNTSDVAFLQDDINKIGDVFTDKAEVVHADGAYHSVENQAFCKQEKIDLHLHAIQGAKGRFKLELLDTETLSVFDLKTNQYIDSNKIIDRKEKVKWRIRLAKGYRYFTQKDIDTYLIRKKIAETPIEILQKRNNVEATIFQLAYHYSNAKSRYRKLIKHQMWANARCLWVNFVRILKYNTKTSLKKTFAAVKSLISNCREYFYAFIFYTRDLSLKKQFL